MSQIFALSEATNRQTKAYWLYIFGIRVLISYETPIAFNGFRRKNTWGPTTGRHMKECGVHDWTVIENEREFNAKLDAAIMANVLRDKQLLQKAVTEAMTGKLAPELV